MIKTIENYIVTWKDFDKEYIKRGGDGFYACWKNPYLEPSLKNKNIIYAFGHHHLGWTLGAITGKIISGIAAGEKTNLDLSPYSSSRFY